MKKRSYISGEKFVSAMKKEEKKFTYKGDIDIISFQDKSGSFIEFEKKDFENDLQELSEYSNYFTKNLPENMKLKFNGIVRIMSVVYDSKIYSELMDIIKSFFNSQGVIVPGTVGSFFVGCSVKDNFKGSITCNPKCAGSLKNDLNDGSCDIQVLIYLESQFKKLNHVKSQRALIYIENPEFTKFTAQNIQELKNEDILFISLIFMEDEGYTRQDDFKSVDSFEVIQPEETTGGTPPSESDYTETWVIILGLLIVFLIFAIFAYLLCKG